MVVAESKSTLEREVFSWPNVIHMDLLSVCEGYTILTTCDLLARHTEAKLLGGTANSSSYVETSLDPSRSVSQHGYV